MSLGLPPCQGWAGMLGHADDQGEEVLRPDGRGLQISSLVSTFLSPTVERCGVEEHSRRLQ